MPQNTEDWDLDEVYLLCCLYYQNVHILLLQLNVLWIKWAVSQWQHCHWVWDIWASSSKFVSAHAQPFRGARDLAFCLKIPLDSLLVWASSEGSGETARIGDKYQIRLTRSNYSLESGEYAVLESGIGFWTSSYTCVCTLRETNFELSRKDLSELAPNFFALDHILSTAIAYLCVIDTKYFLNEPHSDKNAIMSSVLIP